MKFVDVVKAMCTIPCIAMIYEVGREHRDAASFNRAVDYNRLYKLIMESGCSTTQRVVAEFFGSLYPFEVEEILGRRIETVKTVALRELDYSNRRGFQALLAQVLPTSERGAS